MKLSKKISLLIAADGESASGKTTASKLLSKKFGMKLLNSGLLYRFMAYKILKAKNVKSRKIFIKKIAKKINNKNLKNKKLHSPEISKFTSKIAQEKFIRNQLKKYQTNFAKNKLAIIEGRDIGSVIIPNADIKFYFKCSLRIKARRRFLEYRKKNSLVSFKEVKKALKYRDLADSKRAISPLRVLKDSIVVDTSKLNKKQMLAKLSGIVKERIKQKYGRS